MATEAELIARIRKQVGDIATDHIWKLQMPILTSGGTFTLTYNGSVTTALAYNADRTAIIAALEALDTVGAGNVQVEGSPKGPFAIRAINKLGGQDLEGLLQANGASLLPASGGTVETLRRGYMPHLEGDAVQLWDDTHGDVSDLDLRFLLVKRDLLKIRLGETTDSVDSQVGNEQVRKSQSFAHLKDLLAMTEADIQNHKTEAAASDGLNSRFGKIEKTTFSGNPYGVVTRRGYGYRSFS